MQNVCKVIKEILLCPFRIVCSENMTLITSWTTVLVNQYRDDFSLFALNISTLFV
jgi:hypothetical protein